VVRAVVSQEALVRVVAARVVALRVAASRVVAERAANRDSKQRSQRENSIVRENRRATAAAAEQPQPATHAREGVGGWLG
jgi:hypothetical protein